MIYITYLTKYLIKNGVNNNNILVSNTIILATLYLILYRFFYLQLKYPGIRIAIGIMFISNFVSTLFKVNSIVKSRNN